MRTRFAATLVILASQSLAAVAQERSPQLVAAEIHEAATATARAYKQGGMTGLIIQSKACYVQQGKSRFQCIYLDFGARRLGEIAGEGKRFPVTEYFADTEFMPRAAEILVASNMSMDQANQYLLSVRKAMDQATDRALANSMGLSGKQSSPSATLEIEQVRQLAGETYRSFKSGSYLSVLASEKRCWSAAKKSNNRRAALTCGTLMIAGGLIDQAYSRQEMRGSMPGFGPTDQRARFMAEARKLGLSESEADEVLQTVVSGIQEILAGLMLAGMR